MRERMLELYVHIPFCIKKCDYCDFLSFPAGEEERERYVQALLAETDAYRGYEPLADYKVSSIFIGGGTPSILNSSQMERIMAQIREVFQLKSDCEITMEANPGSVNSKFLRTCRECGINRLSLGLQSADNEELKRLGRIHTWEEFLDSWMKARDAGYTNINVDLMSGLPGQSYETWENTLLKMIHLNPEHISAYSLIVEEETPFGRCQEKLNLPNEETERRMYERTHEILESYGYTQYEISNYAREGFECRHNVGYWTGTPYLGLGLGASSYWQQERFSNTKKISEYLEKSSALHEIRCERQKLSLKEQMEEFMILGLRLIRGVETEAFRERFEMEIEAVYSKVLDKYVTLGLLSRKKGRIFLTREGISVSNRILADFLFD